MTVMGFIPTGTNEVKCYCCIVLKIKVTAIVIAAFLFSSVFIICSGM